MLGTAPVPFRKAILDAGPLYSALTLKVVSRRPASHNFILSKNKLKDYLRSPKAQKNFLLIFDNIQTVLTTSHVIGEIKGLQQLKDQHEKDFWRCVVDVFREKKLDERLIRLLELAEGDLGSMIPKIGPVDTGLIELARRERCPLLTEDGKLGGFAKASGIEFHLVVGLI